MYDDRLVPGSWMSQRIIRKAEPSSSASLWTSSTWLRRSPSISFVEQFPRRNQPDNLGRMTQQQASFVEVGVFRAYDAAVLTCIAPNGFIGGGGEPHIVGVDGFRVDVEQEAD